MAIRFRKSVKIAPGLRVNFGKKGISTSIGGRGATVNISKRGTKVTAGIPGTGLSASHLYKSSRKGRAAAPPPEYSPAEWAIAAIAIEVLAIALWVNLSGAISFIGGAVAFLIPGIYIARWVIKQRDEAAIAKELDELVQERAEIEAKGTPKAELRGSDSVLQGKHWSEIVKDHDARGAPSLHARPAVRNRPTYELAESHKHDLNAMLQCCESEESTYWEQPEGSRTCAAPYYFDRVAILSRKAKNYEGEISACERWKAIVDDYGRQPMVQARQAALVHKGARSEAILARLPKARELLRKQKAAAKALAKK